MALGRHSVWCLPGTPILRTDSAWCTDFPYGNAWRTNFPYGKCLVHRFSARFRFKIDRRDTLTEEKMNESAECRGRCPNWAIVTPQRSHTDDTDTRYEYHTCQEASASILRQTNPTTRCALVYHYPLLKNKRRFSTGVDETIQRDAHASPAPI